MIRRRGGATRARRAKRVRASLMRPVSELKHVIALTKPLSAVCASNGALDILVITLN